MFSRGFASDLRQPHARGTEPSRKSCSVSTWTWQHIGGEVIQLPRCFLDLRLWTAHPQWFFNLPHKTVAWAWVLISSWHNRARSLYQTTINSGEEKETKRGCWLREKINIVEVLVVLTYHATLSSQKTLLLKKTISYKNIREPIHLATPARRM